MTNDERVLSSNVMIEFLTADELSSSDVVAGSPNVASTDLETVGGVSIGVWEITDGVVTDTQGLRDSVRGRRRAEGALTSTRLTTRRWRHLVPAPSMCLQ
jgi:hypothetical protein